MSTAIELHKELPDPAGLARDEMIAICKSFADREAPYDEMALSIGLRSVHIPVPGTVSVPISVSSHANAQRYECLLTIEGSAAPRLFPKFSGTISVTPLREYGSELWLQGTYEAPLGVGGRLADATIMHGAATSSLEHFVTWFAAEIAKRIEARERAERRRL